MTGTIAFMWYISDTCFKFRLGLISQSISLYGNSTRKYMHYKVFETTILNNNFFWTDFPHTYNNTNMS